MGDFRLVRFQLPFYLFCLGSAHKITSVAISRNGGKNAQQSTPTAQWAFQNFRFKTLHNAPGGYVAVCIRKHRDISLRKGCLRKF